MDDSPRTLMECERRCATEQACRASLIHLRWPESVRCHRGHAPSVWATRRGLDHGPCCGFQTSVRTGTIVQDTQVERRRWCRAMGSVTNQKSGVSALGLQRAVGLGRDRTAWTWWHTLRAALGRPGRDRLAGAVAVDETDWGGPTPGNPGRGAAGKTLIVVAAQVDGRRIGRLRLRRVPETSTPSWARAVQAAVEPGSVVRTDGVPSDRRLVARGDVHEVVRQEAAVGDTLWPRVHRVVAWLTRWLLGIHHGRVSVAHLDASLDECTFRCNRRTSRWRGPRFSRLVPQAVAVEPAPRGARQRQPAVA